jgi:homogentisate 1,2-dioxygenase
LQGALPVGRNSPQKVSFGLYAEQLSGSPFTAPQASNQRSWLYRIRPTVKHSGRYQKIDEGRIRTAPSAREESDLPIGQLRWGPIPMPDETLTFVERPAHHDHGGDAETRTGMAAHVLLVTASMQNEYFFNADGELLIVAQEHSLRFRTEFGVIDIEPGEICVIQRGMIFKVELIDGPARAYVCENYGGVSAADRGPIGANCLANPRDFLTPVAAYEDRGGAFDPVREVGRRTLCDADETSLRSMSSPGTAITRPTNTICGASRRWARAVRPPRSVDLHRLTAPSETPGTSQCRLRHLPERWQVAENTFRPPWYHRNLMSEFMGLIYGVYDAKPEGFCRAASRCTIACCPMDRMSSPSNMPATASSSR